MNELTKNILRFMVLLFLQIFVLNHVLLQGLITPSLYLLFILLLPRTLPGWAIMLCGFLLGLILDIFMNTTGMHAAACTFIAFIRPTLINLLTPEKGVDAFRISPSIKMMGWSSFLTYAALLTFIHHAIYYSLQVFDFNDIFYLSLKVILSTAITLIMIIIYELLFVRSHVKSSF